MKIALLIPSFCLAWTIAFAQGKVTLGNDSLHLLVFPNVSNLASASGVNFDPYAGLPFPQLGTANDVMKYFTAQLWAGTSSTSLSLAASVPAGQAGFADGRLANTTITLVGIPASIPAFFQIKVFETVAGSFNAAWSGVYMCAWSPLFQATPGSITPNSLVLHGRLATQPGQTVRLLRAPNLPRALSPPPLPLR